MAFKFSDFEGDLGHIAAGITSKKPMVLLREKENEYQVWIEPDYLHIKDLRVFIFGAEYCKFDKDAGTYEIDHDLYCFFKPQSGKLVYSEYGSSLKVCIQNYCTESGKQIESVDDLSCIYSLDNGKFLREKVLTRDKL